jgi:hypothetical protein
MYLIYFIGNDWRITIINSRFEQMPFVVFNAKKIAHFLTQLSFIQSDYQSDLS